MDITKKHIDWAYETLDGVNEAHNLGDAARRALDNNGFWNCVGFYLLGVAIQQDLIDPDNYDWKADTFVVTARDVREIGSHAVNQFVSSCLQLVKRPEEGHKECVS